MSLYIVFLYISTVLIWGSTWLAITYQLGSVDPIISVIYRMLLSSVLLSILCHIRSISLRVSFQNHTFLMAQGVSLFGLNYWIIYMAESYLASGIIAVIFSLIVLFNIINSRIFLKRPINTNIALGAFVGLSGICLLFYPELTNVSSDNGAIMGFALGLTAVFIASLGNMAATRNGLTGLSVWSINAWGTLYGAIALIIIALLTGTEFTYEYSASYTASLVYLAIFGTILAFGAYLKLMILIGPEKAGYGALMIPFVAIILSTLFESYQWTTMAIVGFMLAGLGNYMVMSKKT
ncbi:MAG: DMT family transporter [Porticoccaceae bacterium]|nr:DMT family transporter [Porticoccaceae bacterium]MBT4592476.1 DMT family transporter [Porticoccaceae bacterium]MBT7964732.1 DMT family transporter [Porticoccaceae bacterium]